MSSVAKKMLPPTPIQTTLGPMPERNTAGPSFETISRTACHQALPAISFSIMRVFSMSSGHVRAPVSAPAMHPMSALSFDVGSD
eukprot:CAMPEP_0198718992 /NCGR_PEP_ID=MMETSP1471-20131121/53610_1 /TAXON_ID=41880 /ORGANISM="Pycnococcus provasolii, Strain RCC733" /LENGTH=83 /DNA_ID=CAMNT_0044479703 /DNA_START=110 /DNA_END=361 /DNA_ORIENTATION=+